MPKPKLNTRFHRDRKGRYASPKALGRVLRDTAIAVFVTIAVLVAATWLLEVANYVHDTYFNTRGIVSPMPDGLRNERPVSASERKATTSALYDRYLASKNSPLYGLGTVIYDLEERYGFPHYFLVSLAGKESSFGKRACGFNPLGWDRCKTTFTSWEEGLETVAYKLATLPVYEVWREDRSIAQLAIIYCPDDARGWTLDVKYFREEMVGLSMKGGR